MKVFSRKLARVVGGFVPLVAFTAASDPFVGNWKLDPSKSTLVDQMKVEPAGANKYTLTFSPAGTETVAADGKDTPGLSGTTVSLTVEAPNSWKVTRKKDGRILVTGEWKLSEDGKTLRDHFTVYPAKGSATTAIDYLYARTAGASGFVGTWEGTSQMTDAIGLKIQPWDTDGLTLTFSDADRMHNVKFDGKDYQQAGSDAIAGYTSSGRRLSTETLELIEKLKGTVIDRWQFVLKPDHKTVTMTMYTVGRTKPSVLVFDRE